MKTPELLAPAGSPEALHAAVQSGADAVYLAYGDFNARRNAKNFSKEDFEEALVYCHLRGVKVYLTLNTLLTDRELPRAAETAAEAAAHGIDAIIVQDIGLLRLLRDTLPDTPLHASTQMTVHNLPGVLVCRDLGIRRVVLSRELSRKAIESLCQSSPIELEVFSHGALCMCYSGQCYLSSLVGERSGNRGLCAQPCRLAFRRADETAPSYPLSLKDLSLADELLALSASGVSCLKLEGRMKRPEYVSIVTNIYATLLREGRVPTAEERRDLEDAFSREGFTQGYYKNRLDGSMFGRRAEGAQMPEALLSKARECYTRREVGSIPLHLHCEILKGAPIQLTVSDHEGHSVTAEGAVPEAAISRALSAEQVRAQLSKSGGTVYYANELTSSLDEGLSLPLSSLNSLRREAFDALTAARITPPTRQILPFQSPEHKKSGRTEPPLFTITLLRASQLSDALCAAPCALIYLPPEEISLHTDTIAAYLARHPALRFGVQLPRVAWDHELPVLHEQLALCRSLGIEDALIGNLGLIPLCRDLGFRLRGDFGLGVCNSLSMEELSRLGFVSATASFELNLAQIRDLGKPIDTEFFAYGRLSMMLTEHCLLKKGARCKHCQDAPCAHEPSFLEDRRGEHFPVLRAYGGRSELFNAKTLYLADRQADYQRLGLWAARLSFTTEDADTCAAILCCYLGEADVAPQDLTRGLYYRRVE